MRHELQVDASTYDIIICMEVEYTVTPQDSTLFILRSISVHLFQAIHGQVTDQRLLEQRDTYLCSVTQRTSANSFRCYPRWTLSLSHFAVEAEGNTSKYIFTTHIERFLCWACFGCSRNKNSTEAWRAMITLRPISSGHRVETWPDYECPLLDSGERRGSRSVCSCCSTTTRELEPSGTGI